MKNLPPEWQCWAGMIQRCTNPKRNNYHNYGGRGISVYAGWSASFKSFLADVGPRPSAKHTLDRIDNDGNYEPGNVQWATRREQARNRRGLCLVTVGEETMPVIGWAEKIGISPRTLYSRLQSGASIEGLINGSEVLRGRPGFKAYRYGKRSPVLEFRGESKPVYVWAESLGMSTQAMRTRLKLWPLEKAMTTPPMPTGRRSRKEWGK